MIDHVVELGDRDPGNPAQGPEQFKAALPPVLSIALNKLARDLFSLAHDHDVKEIRERFRIEKGADAAQDHERIIRCSFIFIDSDAGEPQHFQDIEIVLFKGDGKSKDIELPDRPFALQTVKPGVALVVLFDISLIRQEHAFACRVSAAVQDGVDLVHAEIRHAYVVGVRIGKRDRHSGIAGFIDGPALSSEQGIGFFEKFSGHAGIILCLMELGKEFQTNTGSWPPINAVFRR